MTLIWINLILSLNLEPFTTLDICHFRQYTHCRGLSFRSTTFIWDPYYIPGQYDPFPHNVCNGRTDQPHLCKLSSDVPETPLQKDSLSKRQSTHPIRTFPTSCSWRVASISSQMVAVGVPPYTFLRLTINASCKSFSLNYSAKAVQISSFFFI